MGRQKLQDSIHFEASFVVYLKFSVFLARGLGFKVKGRVEKQDYVQRAMSTKRGRKPGTY